MDGSTNSVRIPQDNAAIKQLADKLTEKSIQVEITSQDSSIVSELLFFAIFPGIPLLILYLMLSRGGKGGFKRIFGISSVNALKEKNSKITFKDVAGIDEVKEELKEVVDFLKDSKKYDSLGAKVPKGVLLVGPPGTGKTLCAKAIAGEANVPFFGLSGADFVEMFVGVGAARVRDLFSQAKKNAPCLVFIDELDAVGRQRGTGLGSGHDEREQTLNQLLVNMDGFDSREGIVVIAATNRPDVLDTALLRPGRFDRQIVVDRPDIKGREAILAVHAKGKPFADDANLKIIAQRTAGFTGADLANLLNEAALLAGRKSKSMISMDELEEAIDKVIAGPEKKSRIISPEDKKLTAYHEGGHALVAHFEKNSDPLHKVTIIPRGMALGLTMTLPEEDHLSYTKAQLLSRIKVMLGGRVAEEIIFGEENVTTGAENDLKRATELLNKMITKFGMSDELGLLTFGDSNEQVFLGRDFANNTKNYSESVASKIDAEMKKIITELHKEVKDLLLQKRKHLDAVAQVLLEKEAVDKEEFIGVIEEVDKGTFKFEG
ncbi:MAG: ATP-dependent zinc metalloprotease FtsH [Candidatus Melainabacteria bacterium]|nr:ATP-dependent zinc metalloprotease FtsH [Candidatus Melainabacteria bacterium]